MQPRNLSKIIRISHALSAGLFFISLIVLGYLHLQFRGYWTPKIIAWFWLINTVIYFIYFWRTIFVKVYLTILGVLLVLSIMAMAIPLFAFVNYVSTLDDYQRFTLNDDYRIEFTRQQALSMPWVYVYHVKNVIFEENPMRPAYSDIVKEVLGEKSLENGRREKDIPITDAKLVKTDAQGVYIDYTIQNQHKVIFHPFKNDDGY